MLALAEGSPVCTHLLRSAQPRILQERLELHFHYDASFILFHRKLESRITAYFQDNFNTLVSFHYPQAIQANIPAKPVPPQSPQALSSPQPSSPEHPPAPRPKQEDRPFARRGKNASASETIVGTRLSLDERLVAEREVIVEGQVFDFERRETKSGSILIILQLYDKCGSITAKFFCNAKKSPELETLAQKGNFIAIRGTLRNDEYSREVTLVAEEIAPATPPPEREDRAPKEHKRIELHLHTQMSSMDGITNVASYIRQAARWGHRAIAVTDHGVVQAFPEAAEAAKKHGIKLIYGMEAFVVDDTAAIARLGRGQDLNTPFVVFDIETTGLNPGRDVLTEIGALRLQNGEITERFSTFVNPGRPISAEITKLTGITDEMVANAPPQEQAVTEFLDFVGSDVLVAHNADFDISFINAAANLLNLPLHNTYLDTLELSRLLFPQLKRHKLDIVAAHLGIPLETHHRAIEDATATAQIFLRCCGILKERGCQTLADINALAQAHGNKSRLRPYHTTLLVQNQHGLRNLYELVSISHLQHYYKRPLVPKSELVRLREGLLLGTACTNGELYQSLINRAHASRIAEITAFYDFFEIHPVSTCLHLCESGRLGSQSEIQDINRRILDLGNEVSKPVAAVSNAHFLCPEDEIFRKIILTGDGRKAECANPCYLKTTDEILKELSYLNTKAYTPKRSDKRRRLRLTSWQNFVAIQERLSQGLNETNPSLYDPSSNAYKAAITAPNTICNVIEDSTPIPEGSFPPELDGAVEELTNLTHERTAEIYGSPPPFIIQERLKLELSSIIENGFAVMYVSAARLVAQSVADGYLVGSRGSVGSSFVATMAGITEVNPLPPHYICPRCKFSDFESETVRAFAGASGCDMPEKACPACAAMLHKDGHDIPFETFLGIDGDKEPDIDLNFSGEYQAAAHTHAEQLFGQGNVVRAGTISTMAEKTAYGYVRKYLEHNGTTARSAEINRLRSGCTGIKRTTGQHPGGLMILPQGRSIYEFCPVQHPANDASSGVITTHFDYHALSGKLMKLDILGHDVPTILRILQSLTGIDPLSINIADKAVLSLFTSPQALGISEEAIRCNTGTLGLPEFGTAFVRSMLADTQPSSFAELVRISGLSHGTDVWLGNAAELIRQGTATLKEVIPTRDDIMVYLVHKGVDRLVAFKIMENVRKGKGLSVEEADLMQAAGIPSWYIDSCRKIKYMFPKGHAVAYVMMSVRIGFYKVYHPLAFYAAVFSVKTADFNYDLACKGQDTVRQELARLESLGRDEATAKERNLQSLLELVNEMYARGLEFAPLSLYECEAEKFRIMDGKILPPLASVAGLGGSVAGNIVASRQNGPFLSVEDFRARTKATKPVIQLLKENGSLLGLSPSNQMTLI